MLRVRHRLSERLVVERLKLYAIRLWEIFYLRVYKSFYNQLGGGPLSRPYLVAEDRNC